MATTLSSVMSGMNGVSTPLGILSGTDREFSEALGSLRSELAPSGLVETLMVDRVVLGVSRLRALVAGESAFEATGEEIAQAEQAIDRALDALITARSARAEGWGHPAQASTRIGDVSSLPPMAYGEESSLFADDVAPASVEEADEFPWRERLSFDEQVSHESPVVRGTWITAGQVVSLIVDGWAWGDILRHYPELTERDIRACLSYTVEQDGPIAL